MGVHTGLSHYEVIVAAGLLAVTVLSVVTAVVSTAVYLATREASPGRQSVVARDAVPANAARAETRADVRSPMATAG